MGFKTLYEAIRKSRIVSAFPGGSPVTVGAAPEESILAFALTALLKPSAGARSI